MDVRLATTTINNYNNAWHTATTHRMKTKTPYKPVINKTFMASIPNE